MVLINSMGIVVFASILCATMCSGKNLYEDLDSGSDLTEVKRPAFYAGSRYGRSQFGTGSSKLRIAPRRDFHFLRYGKRSDDSEDSQGSPVNTIQCYENVRDYVLTCSYTGIQDYYRCWKGQENKFIALDKIPSDVDDKNNQQL